MPKSIGPTELQIQITVVDWLKLTQPDCLWFHVPNGEHRSPRVGAKLKAMGVRPGVADLCFIWNKGAIKIGFIELKTAQGRATETQRFFAAEAESFEAEYAVARDLEQVQYYLRKWGAI